MKDLSDRARLWRRRQRRRRARAAERRGVLMLVVLSMLVLFLLIGTTFLLTSSQHRTASKIVEKANRTTFQPEDVLERALMQALRDTNNRNSVVRHHSLLLDYYGTDGFISYLYPAEPPVSDPVAAGIDVLTPGEVNTSYLPTYAGVDPTTVDNTGTAADERLGVTGGQLVDLFIRDDPTEGAFDFDNVVGLELDEDGLPFEHGLSRTDEYYSGCVLTILDGPCRGSSVRVIEYDYLGLDNGHPVGRFRVTTPQRFDGRPLQFTPLSTGADGAVLEDFVVLLDFNNDNVAELNEIRGNVRVLVNGRPLNGTGVGFDAYASPNRPRLSALEPVRNDAGVPYEYMELALAPNSVHSISLRSDIVDNSSVFDGSTYNLFTRINTTPEYRFLTNNGADVDDSTAPGSALYRGFVGPGGADESYDAPDFQNVFLASQSPRPRVRGRVVVPDGASPNGFASIDPEAHYAGTTTLPQRLDLEDLPIPSFHRPALVNYWLHRIYNRLVGDGVAPQDAALAMLLPYGADFRRNTPGASADATQDNGAVSLELRDLIVDIKRRAMFRPLREDHPDFDGSNPLSTYDTGTTAVGAAFAGPNVVNPTTGEITFPYWEAVGPWDVDNDRDGAPDSVWVDLGLPIQKTEDGRQYKPLVAFLIEDLDGRLNLNAHGSTEHFVNDDLDFSRRINPLTGAASGNFNSNLAQDYDSDALTPGIQNPPELFSSNQLPHGAGWGPADISLRPILSPELPLRDFSNMGFVPLTGDAQYDDYARLLVGRPHPSAASRIASAAVQPAATWGRYGTAIITGNVEDASVGRNFDFDSANPLLAANTREERVPFDFAGYPEFATQPLRLSGFGERPDLFSRYSVGLSPIGAPVREAVTDGWIDVFNGTTRPTLDDNPYELNLSDNARRRSVADYDAIVASYANVNTLPSNPLNDDATFSPAELERVLRAFDTDADKLPDRLWNLVDAFDPDKLAVQNAIAGGVTIPNPDNFVNYRPNALETIVAQTEAARNRRQVTTESFDPPVPNENWTARLILGADGLPGVPVANIGITPTPNPDDDGDTLINEGDEAVAVYTPSTNPNAFEQHTFSNGPVSYAQLWANGCDDYPIVMLSDPPPSARITDYFRYRIVLQLARDGIIDLYPASGNPTDRTSRDMIDALVNQILFGVDPITKRPLSTTEVRDDTVPVPLPTTGLVAADLYSYGGLLAPEVLAGLKMNLNRPFGDGRDNNGNGVVDEPQEAGEPYVYVLNSLAQVQVVTGLDQNNDGLHNQDRDGDGILYVDTDGDGVPDSFDVVGGTPNVGDLADFDGDGVFEPTVDHVWIDADGDGVRDPLEFHPFDYTRGADVNGRGAYVDSDGDGVYDLGTELRVHDDALLARQLYARHLYCLMLALMDDGYLAPIDETDPQVRHYLDPRSGSLLKTPAFPDGIPGPGSSAAYRIAYDLGRIARTNTFDPKLFSNPAEYILLAEARRQAMRKLTVRQVAQWAINCVDLRDPDAIQTPFEYDENPWDGWNVVVSTVLGAEDIDGDGVDDVVTIPVTDPITGNPVREVLPLDGDLATNENNSSVREIIGGADGWARDTTDSDGDNDFTEQVIRKAPFDRRLILSEQTRGVVWGAERPELLMTEGLAMHDRRLVDQALLYAEGRVRGSGVPASERLDLSTIAGGDDDPDQLLRPRGSAFLELYNPWSADDQKPRELYSRQRTFLTRPGPSASGSFLLQPDIDVPIPPNEIRPNIPYRPDSTAFYENVEGIALDRLSNASAVRRDPTRFGELRDGANLNGKRMRIDNDGFRVPPPPAGVGGIGGDLLPPAASPVWRVICVEEHPDVRNAINQTTESTDLALDDNPYADPNTSDSPWMYSAGPGDAIPSGAANFPVLPFAYSQVADLQEFNAGAPLSPTISAPLPRGTVFRQADPDWPEFDRFERPQRLSVASLNVRQVDIDVAEITATSSMNTQVTVDRLRLMKPDRYIERAWYFIGAPEIDPPAGFGGPPRRSATVPVLVRRNLIQPGLLIPDLSYEYDGTITSGVDISALQDQVILDYDHNGTAGGSASRSVATPAGLEFYRPNASSTTESMLVHGNRFVVTDLYDADRGLGLAHDDLIPVDVPEVAESLPIAPILPGRYAVIGPSSIPFDLGGESIDLTDRFGRNADDYIDDATSLKSRHATFTSLDFFPALSGPSTINPQFERRRRVELIPSSNPDWHQVVVRFNGWASVPRSSEVVPTADPFDYTQNSPVDRILVTNLTELTDPINFSLTLDGDTRLIQPVVAIPMDGFNISEPLDGYHLRRNEIYQTGPGGAVTVRVAPTQENPDGQTLGATDQRAPADLSGFDQPLDVLAELGIDPSPSTASLSIEERNQTTPAYRTLHLQRLANPLLAWNPTPLRPNGEPVPEHDPARPVNPYLTVDSLPMDLIAYNGAQSLSTAPGSTSPGPRPIASSERGIAPATQRIDPNDAILDNTSIPLALRPSPTFATIDSTELTPRDLWRAVSGLMIDNDPAVKYGPVSSNHPDTDLFNNGGGGPGSAAGGVAGLYDAVLQHSLGFANRGFGNPITNADLAGVNVADVDLNGDQNRDPLGNVRMGELTGASRIDLADDNPADNSDSLPDYNANNAFDAAVDGDGVPDDIATRSNNDPAPALHWPNRPFLSAGELTLVPMWSSSRLLTHYSTFNASLADQRNPYDGDLVLDNATPPNRLSPDNLAAADPRVTNRFRWRNERAPFGHLLPFFVTATGPARAIPWSNPGNPPTTPPIPNDVDVIAYGAPHFYRILDYVHTPSRFVETDTLLNPQVFGQLTQSLDDPRVHLSAPYNRVDHYREPGRVNLNTVATRRDALETPSSGPRSDRPADLWSATYDGLMHRREDYGAIDHINGQLLQMGHLGPAWRDVALSRRGYLQPTFVDGPTSGIDYSPGVMHPNFPTMFANPLRSPEGGFNVPVEELLHGGVDATMLRAHALSPGEDGAWSIRTIDDNVVDKDIPTNPVANRDLIRDDAGEAGVLLDSIDISIATGDANGDGRDDGDIPSVRSRRATPTAPIEVLGTIPDSLALRPVTSTGAIDRALPPTAAPTPMFSGASTEPALNTERNPQMRYSPIARLTNLTTGRSGVFAVWITVGYFEVTPVNETDHPQIWDRYQLGIPDGADAQQLELTRRFFQVYQDGMTIGREIDIDTGENRRMRGFYLVDRTLPVGFKPGDDVNVEDAILLRRRIE